jgi:hypothetical protein
MVRQFNEQETEKELEELKEKVKTYQSWLFSYKDDTRILTLTHKVRFCKIFDLPLDSTLLTQGTEPKLTREKSA